MLRNYWTKFLIVAVAACLIASAAAPNLYVQKLRGFLDLAIEATPTPGAVLLVDSPETGTIVLASGKSDKFLEIEMTPQNRFRLGSITKTFVAVCILQLVEEGKIDLDEPAQQYLPKDFASQKIPTAVSSRYVNYSTWKVGSPITPTAIVIGIPSLVILIAYGGLANG